MTIAQLVLKCLLLITSIKLSLESKEQRKPYCPPGDFGCIEERPQRDVVLNLIDYDNENVMCDEDHPFFCDIVDPFQGIKEKSKKKSIDNTLILPEQIEKKNHALTANGNKLVSNKADSFECIEYGFFPDYNNPQMFYHCAHSLEKDEGFLLHHRKCPSGLKFNTIKKKCDVYKLATNGKVLVEPSFSKNQEITELFHCKHNGLYPDKFNASMFWYCERNSKNGFTVTKMLCPDDELFDPVKKLCVFVDVPRNVRSDSSRMQNKFQTKSTNINKGISNSGKLSWLPP